MVIGVLIYYALRPVLTLPQELVFYDVLSHGVQPTLIFAMLFLSFLKVEPSLLRPHRWHGVLLLVQGSLFVACSLLAVACKDIPLTMGEGRGEALLLFECAMLCFICPTATASAVIVQKLGGSLSGDVTYIILCNLMVSILAPTFLPLVEPQATHGWAEAFFLIIGKVFPLLLCPLFVAMIVRHYMPRLMQRLLAIRDLAFYLWLVALAFAITVTVRTIDESRISVVILAGFAVISALCCVVQFALGKYIGRRFFSVEGPEVSSITAGQAFGQKNTVFVIWMGLVFLNPITSVVGGFYSIWHNIVNSWQLYKKSKA